jgi:hypothetical protein
MPGERDSTSEVTHQRLLKHSGLRDARDNEERLSGTQMVDRDILAKSPTATLLFRSAVLATPTIHDPVTHCDMPEKDGSAIPSWTYSFSSGLALTA